VSRLCCAGADEGIKMKQFFISFASENRELAEYIHKYLNNLFQGECRFWLSTEIAPGADWQTKLLSELDKSHGLLLLLTPQSLEKRWVNVEAGACWVAKKPIFPLICGGVSVHHLQPPITAFQAVQIEERSSVRQLVSEIAVFSNLRVPPIYDASDFAKQVRKLTGSAGAFTTINQATKKLHLDSIITPLIIEPCAIKLETLNLCASVNNKAQLIVNGTTSDADVLSIAFSKLSLPGTLLLEISNSDHTTCNAFGQLLKLLVNGECVLPIAMQQHWNDSQYIGKEDGVYAYEVFRVSLIEPTVVTLVFWKAQLGHLSLRFLFSRQRRKISRVQPNRVAATMN
jgi:hypothetical protein